MDQWKPGKEMPPPQPGESAGDRCVMRMARQEPWVVCGELFGLAFDVRMLRDAIMTRQDPFQDLDMDERDALLKALMHVEGELSRIARGEVSVERAVVGMGG